MKGKELLAELTARITACILQDTEANERRFNSLRDAIAAKIDAYEARVRYMQAARATRGGNYFEDIETREACEKADAQVEAAMGRGK